MRDYLIYGFFIVASVWVWSWELRGHRLRVERPRRAERPQDVCADVCVSLMTTEATACLRVSPEGSVFARNCGEINYRSGVYEDRVRPVQVWLRRLRPEAPTTFILKYEDAVTRADTWIHDVDNIIAFDCLCDLRHRIILIPDHWFLRTRGYVSWMFDIDIAATEYPWDRKTPQTVFRGSDSGERRLLIENLDDDPNLDISYNIVHTAGSNLESCGFNCRTARFIASHNRNRSSRAASRLRSPRMNWKQMLSYRGVLDLDSFSNSWPGAFWKLRGNSVVLKQTSPWCQWYYHRLEPFVHYVPIRSDLGDLSEWTRWVADDANGETARRISAAATDLIGTLSTERALDVLRSKSVFHRGSQEHRD